jgi:hypothetical protein
MARNQVRLDIVKPVEPSRGNRRILYEFSNRGNRGLMGFNYGRGAAEEPARRLRSARTADSGGGLYRPLGLRTAITPASLAEGASVFCMGFGGSNRWKTSAG